MRKVNKQIIILSLILATVFLNGTNVSANTAVKRGYVNKNQELVQSKNDIETALKNNDYNLFTQTLKKLNINDSITNEQFTVLVNAYKLFKENKQAEAVKLLKDNNVNPILIKFINNRPDLTDAQKEALKKASDLIKQGKTEEAKAIISAAGLPTVPKNIDHKINKIENKANKEDIKKALDKARELRKEGKLDEAKKVLKDAGVPDQIQDKIHFASTTVKDKKTGILQTIKNLFVR